jgi:hypothetical protein
MKITKKMDECADAWDNMNELNEHILFINDWMNEKKDNIEHVEYCNKKIFKLNDLKNYIVATNFFVRCAPLTHEQWMKQLHG